MADHRKWQAESRKELSQEVKLQINVELFLPGNLSSAVMAFKRMDHAHSDYSM